MKKLFTAVLFLSSIAVFGQGEYDVRFDLDNIDCDNAKLYVNVDVRASTDVSAFQIAEQNYRFSFNRDAISINSTTVNQEGDLSSFIFKDGALVALYAEHNLSGSLDSVVSYNVELQGGEGVMLTTEWVNVGSLGFDVNDFQACLDLTWHSGNLFPPTFVSTNSDTGRVTVPGSLFLDEMSFSCYQEVCDVALPVELSSFDAINGDACSILLEWTTNTETNNDYFVIEKSRNGINYKAIGTVKGAGNSNTAHTYTFIDQSPSINNYYRLKQIDMGGIPTVSSQLVIRSTCFDDDDSTVEVFPNPVREEATVKFYNDNLGETKVVLAVSDALGRLVHTETLAVNEGANLLQFTTKNLVSGTYYVQLRGSQWVSVSQKMVKID